MTTIRTTAKAALVAALGLSAALAAAPAQAEGGLPIDWNVDATTHLAKLDKDLVVPTGSFTGEFDFATSTITGDLDLPPATSELDLGGLPLATVTMVMEQAAPVTGRMDLATLQATTTSTFNVRITEIRPVLLPFINLVKPTCRTRTPVVAELNGKVNLAQGSTFTGTYDLPRFANCGFAVTELINAIVPGEGNTMTAKFTPRQ